MSSNHIIMRAPESPEDLLAYYGLRWRVLRMPLGFPPAAATDPIDQQQCWHMAAYLDTQTVGVARLWPARPDVFVINWVAVDESVQRRNIGTHLISELTAIAEREGAQLIMLNARRNAEPFYASLGFEVVRPAKPVLDSTGQRRFTQRLMRLSLPTKEQP